MTLSPLYERFGRSSKSQSLLRVIVGADDISDKIISISISSGGADVSRHEPTTITIETSAAIRPPAGAAIEVTARPPLPVGAQIRRFLGRVAGRQARDTGRRGRWGTTITGASWDSVLHRSPHTWTPTNGAALSTPVSSLGAPPWAPLAMITAGLFDQFLVDGDPKPITAAEWIQLLESRLYLFTVQRVTNYRLRVLSLPQWETEAAAQVDARWPLSRAHCVSPTRWEQPSDFSTAYRVHLNTSEGPVVQTSGTTSPNDRVEDLDWTTTRSRTEQWRRIHGLRFASFGEQWRLPQVTCRVDLLAASRFEDHRNAAGMLLSTNVLDIVPLAGDWPSQVGGAQVVTSLAETITHRGWTITLGLAPWYTIAGQTSPPIRPRTWAHTRAAWSAPTTQTWQEGPLT